MYLNFCKIAAFVIFSKTSDISSNIHHANPAGEPLLLFVHLPSTSTFGFWAMACGMYSTSHLSVGQGLGWSMWGESCLNLLSWSCPICPGYSCVSVRDWEVFWGGIPCVHTSATAELGSRTEHHPNLILLLLPSSTTSLLLLCKQDANP